MDVFMEPFHVFAFYAALNAAIMLALGMLVVRSPSDRPARKSATEASRRWHGPLRAHANNTEYVPVALLLMLGASAAGRFGLAGARHRRAARRIGRVLHAIGLSQKTVGPSTLRLHRHDA